MAGALVLEGPLRRGSREWDQRELMRQALGCRCIGIGEIPKGELTVQLDMRQLPRWRQARAQIAAINRRQRPKEVEHHGNEGEDRQYGAGGGA